MRHRTTVSLSCKLFRHGAILAALALCAAEARGADNAWTTGGPAGGAVSSLAVDPSNPNVLFAGTEMGVFRSDDRGQTWSTAPVGPQGARILVFDPSRSSILFAGNSEGVFRSTDGGGHFSLTGLHESTAVLAIDPSNPTTIYAGGPNAGVQKSTNGGDSWTSLSTEDLVRSIASLVLDQTRPGTVLAGADWDDSLYYFPFQGVIKTTDGGASWSQVFSPYSAPGPQAVNALVADPRSSDIVYAGVSYWRGGYVARTEDGGATWHSFGFPLIADVSSLVIDPLEPGTLYAGTDHGVFRSTDAAANWSPLADGLTDMRVRSLAIDPDGEFLHAATGGGVFDLRVERSAPAFPCSPATNHLCLLGRRFLVTLFARDPRTGRATFGAATVQADGFGSFSLPAFTGDPTLPEIFVKMIDATASEWNSFWLFFGGLTDVEFALTVTDTVSGRVKTYRNDPSRPFCGGASSFPADTAGVQTGTVHASTESILAASGTELSLLSGRFAVTLSATDPRTGRTSHGAAIPQNDRFGYFSLPDFTGDANLPEILVKMIDETSLTQTFWLFHTGLTDVEYTLSVADLATGLTRRYQSSGAFCGGADTSIPPASP